METWLNELYNEGSHTTIGTYTKWLLEYIGSLGGITLIFIMGLLTLMFVIYVKMIRSFVKGLLLTLIISMLCFFAYYLFIFKSAYPMELLLNAVESSSSQSLLDEKELQRLDVQSVAVSAIEEELDRSEIAIIGTVDNERLKKLMFTIRNDENKLETFTLYGYVSEKPSTGKKDYITYYELDKKALQPAMQGLPFFKHDMYNILVYKRENNLESPTDQKSTIKAIEESTQQKDADNGTDEMVDNDTDNKADESEKPKQPVTKSNLSEQIQK